MPPCAFDFDQNLSQNVAQIILYYHVLSISECFEKTLIAFDFDEKLTQSIAQLTMYVSWVFLKRLFPLSLKIMNFTNCHT